MDRVHIEEVKRRIGEAVTIAGWVSRTRDLGNLKFILLRDITGDIQITVKRDSRVFLEAEGLGREDIISARGRAVKSDVAHAGVEFFPDSIEVLNRSRQPLPFDVSGQVRAEMDTRLNYRFMDFRTPRTLSIFRIQHEMLTTFRRFLTDRGYIEIQPPCIIASASEGGAELFKIPYFEREAYLAQSPQLYKQMCAISFEKVFTVVPVWRAEKFNTPTHLNEVRQMDIEQAFADGERALAAGFQLSGGKLVGPRDMFADVSFDNARQQAKDVADFMRAHGPFEPHRLPLEEMEYTTMPQVMKKLESRFNPLD